jgi:transformation/transcription domain-associated protein
MKTGHPLMILTIETMVDQILQRFKVTPEEEIYRLVCMLLGDAVQVSRSKIIHYGIKHIFSQGYATRASSADDDGQLASMTVANLQRMVASLTGPARVRILCSLLHVFFSHINEKKDYEEDFLKSKPTQYEYVQRLQQWRDRYEKSLGSRPRIQSLDLLSHYLAEFQYGKFDEIEVPGQYTEVMQMVYSGVLWLIYALG